MRSLIQELFSTSDDVISIMNGRDELEDKPSTTTVVLVMDEDHKTQKGVSQI
jgi:hypothetical protein